MWKPIEIKPGDQSLVGKKVRPKHYQNPEITILFVGQKCFLGQRIVSMDSEFCEDAYPLCEEFLLWEDDPKPTHWVPKEGEEYWYVYHNVVLTGNVHTKWCHRDEIFTNRNGNFYRTREHAELAAKYVKEAHAKAHEEIGE